MAEKIKTFYERKNKEFSDMEQWDVICIRCGKHLFSEQRASTAGDIHRLHETNDEFYDEIKAEFYCTKCARDLGYNTDETND